MDRADVEMTDRKVTFEASRFSFSDFSALLDRLMDRPVVTKSGLTGVFDFHLMFAPDDSTPGFPHCLHVSVLPIFRVLRERLGLNLEPGTGPVEFLRVDDAERPVAN
jgi:uncharacterized protein (TIGR03435 family)